jgi:hypothetical protein
VMARGLYLNFTAGEHGDPAAGSEDSQWINTRHGGDREK